MTGVYSDIDFSSSDNGAADRTATTVTVGNLEDSSEYFFRLAACAASATTGCSRFYASNSAGTLPDADASYTLTFSNNSATGFDISWNASSGSYFRLQRSTSSGVFAEVSSATSTSYSDSGLTANTSYSYRLQVCGTSNSSSCLAAGASFSFTTTPNIPSTELFSFVASSDAITASWTAVTGTVQYRLQSSTQSNTGFSTISTGTNTSYQSTGLPAASSYYYRLLACNIVSDLSSCATSASYNAGTQLDSEQSYTLTFSNNSATGFDISWTVTEGNFYRLQRSTSTGVFAEVSSGTSTSHSDTGLTFATEYYYRLQLCGGANSDSCNSAGASFSFISAPPVPNYNRLNASEFSTSGSADFGPHLWSDGTTLWASDNTDDKIYAYNLATTARDAAKDFNTLSAAGNNTPVGIWSDGVTMWVADSGDDKIYAYNLATKARDMAKDFDTLIAAGNTYQRGLWSDGTTMWVADFIDDKIYAYNLATKARDAAKDFSTLTLTVAGNNNLTGIWSDGTTMWVVDYNDSKVYAYNLATKARDAAKDINVLVAAGNNDPVGMWSDGTTVWISDFTDDYIYAYELQPLRFSAVSQNSLAISWTAVTSATHYILQSSTSSDGVYSQLYAGSSTSFSHTGLTAATQYHYQIAACLTTDTATCTSFYGNRAYSTQPASNASYTLTFSNNSATSFDISWSASSGSYFRLQRSTSTGVFTPAFNGSSTSHSDTGLTAATEYYYRLQLCGGANSGSCNSAGASFSFTTTPSVQNHSRVNSSEFNTSGGADSGPHLWSDGTTLWASDYSDDKIFAYNLATTARDATKDFNTLGAAGNNTPRGIWSDGVTMWVADNIDDKIYAYNLTTKARDMAKEFNTLSAASNNSPRGLWSDGTTMWVADIGDNKVYAYNLATKARDEAKDFDTLTAAGNTNPQDIWSDGTTMWVVDFADTKIYAYNLATKARDMGKDINVLVAAGNSAPIGIGSDGATMWVSDFNDDYIYAYELQPLRFSAVSQNSLAISWTAVTGASHYILQSSTSSDGTYSQLYAGSSTGFSHTGLTAATQYHYQIAACTTTEIATCTSFYGNRAHSTQPASNASYTLTFSNNSTTSFNISWTASSGSYFRLQRSTSTGVFVAIFNGSSTSHSDTGLTANTAYYYRLQLCSGSNSSSCLAAGSSATATTNSAKFIDLNIANGSVQLEIAPVIAAAALPPVAEAVGQSALSVGSNSAANGNGLVLGNYCSVIDDIYLLRPRSDGSLFDQYQSYRWGDVVYGDWDAVIAYANSQQICGFSDWRIPTADELQQLANSYSSFQQLQLAIPNLLADKYWTDQSVSSDKALAFDFASSVLVVTNKYQYQRVILIRVTK